MSSSVMLQVTMNMDLAPLLLASSHRSSASQKSRGAKPPTERFFFIHQAGANVVLTTKGIDDMCMKYLVEAGAIGECVLCK